MSVRIFGLGGVPTEEAQGVRDALDDAGIDYFESPPGSPGTFHGTQGPDAAAIWVADEAAVAARAAVNEFQNDWRQKAKVSNGLRAEDTWQSVAFKLLVGIFGIVFLVQVARVFMR